MKLLVHLFALSALLAFAPFHAAIGAPKTAQWRAPLTCPLEKAGWSAQVFEGRAANQLSCAEGALRIASRNSISLHAIRPPAKFAAARRLTWDWRVRDPAGPSNLQRKGADDRSIAVLVAFRYNPKTASLSERMLRPLLEARKGPDAPGRVLAYTWIENRKGAPKAIMKSPYGGAAHRIVPLARRAGDWRGEAVDLAADHRRAFGPGAYQVQYVAIAADTDDLGGDAQAEIRNLKLRR